ncbi:DDE-type integrase/transposase/recombinase [Streptomyces sp. ISL-94]|uniref:DDE-type integrase/transposase/recombinase n=1 Tax=Streptomyces sp. ISL-94 TaxID=2819190 RepID=UPI0027E450F2|nr:DDE-type integrase/transposase/recombinase [Streptomyces sp. ISL-94]
MNTVANLMAELDLVPRKVRYRKGLSRPEKRPAAPDFVQRDFTSEAPDLVWAGDMTEIVTEEGKLYLATVIDLFSRRLLSYAMSARHDADLVVAALNMAAATRGGDVRSVIFHLDRGRVRLAEVHPRLPPTGRDTVHGPGRLVLRQCRSEASTASSRSSTSTVRPRTQARIRIATWITDVYNIRRLHSVWAQEPDRLRERVLRQPHCGA